MNHNYNDKNHQLGAIQGSSSDEPADRTRKPHPSREPDEQHLVPRLPVSVLIGDDNSHRLERSVLAAVVATGTLGEEAVGE